MTKPRLKSGLCCIWRAKNVAFAVTAGVPVQSVRLRVPNIERSFLSRPFVVLGVCEFLTQGAGLDASPVKSPIGSYLMTKPRLKSGLCCIWRAENVAFAVAAGMPVQSVRS
ncbi:hypothetical protein F0250_23250 [Vibrio cyclitrophicus]|nr:hypothetical protein [Vibrio cyclitrophicus]QCI69912.1 hypothetical protein FAZ90_01965 [Vibrio cyclitrophicus]